MQIERNTNTHVNMYARVFHPHSEPDSFPLSLTLGVLGLFCVRYPWALSLSALGADAEGKAEGRQPRHGRAAKGAGITNAANRAGLGLGGSSDEELLGIEDRSAAVPRTPSPGINFPVVFNFFPIRDLPSIGVSA